MGDDSLDARLRRTDPPAPLRGRQRRQRLRPYPRIESATDSGCPWHWVPSSQIPGHAIYMPKFSMRMSSSMTSTDPSALKSQDGS